MSDILLPGVVRSEVPLGFKAPGVSGGGNLMETLQGAARLQLMGNQNNLFQQTFDAQKAMGPLAQQAVDEHGKFDPDKFSELISQDPRTAFKAPEMLQALAARKLTMTETEGKQLDQALLVQKSAHTALASILGKPNPSSDDLYSTAKQFITSVPAELQPRLAKSVAAMIIDAPKADPSEPNFQLNSQRLKEWAMGHYGQSGQTLDMLKALAGEIDFKDTGGQQTAVQSRPGLGTVTTLGGLNKTMEPGAAGAVIPGAGPGGSAAIRSQLGGTGEPTPPGTTLGGPEASAGDAAQAPGEITPIGLTEAMKEYSKAGGEGVAKYEDAVHETVRNSLPLVQRIGQEMEALQNFQAGPGETTRARLAEVLTAVGLPDTAKTILRGELKDVHFYESLIAQQAIETLKQALGGQGRITNLEVDAFFRKYPNLSTDPGAIEKVYNFVKQLSGQYYNQQQSMASFRQLMKAGKLPAGTDMQDFPAWYSKQMVDSGNVNFQPTFGEAKGSTLTPPAGGASRKSLDEIFKGLPK